MERRPAIIDHDSISAALESIPPLPLISWYGDHREGGVADANCGRWWQVWWGEGGVVGTLAEQPLCPL